MISSSSLLPDFHSLTVFCFQCLLKQSRTLVTSGLCIQFTRCGERAGLFGLKVSFTWASGRTQYYRKQLWFWSETLRHVIELHLYPGFIIKKSLLSSFPSSRLPPQGLCPRLASVGYFYENDLELLKIILPPHLVHEVQKLNRGKEFACSGIKEIDFYSEQIRKQLECFKQRNSTLSDRIWWIVVGSVLRLEVSEGS